MAYAIRGEIKGLSGVLAALKEVDNKVAKKALRKGVSGASGKLLKAAKRQARQSRKSGLLIRSLGRKIKVYRNTGRVIGIVGPRTGFKQEVVRQGRTILANPTRYAHLVELGTVRSQAKPFLKPALDEQSGAMSQAVFDAVNEALASMRSAS